MSFSGSYAAEDVTFLLKPVALSPTPVAEKERRIQSGQSHYSEMISLERRPDARYLALFEAACVAGVARLAADVRRVALALCAQIESGTLDRALTLCSLVRAGVPYGILLRRDLQRLGVDVAHYGVSIIRDRGLDAVAMAHILQARPLAGVVFVDGWTGKGAIATQLAQSWQQFSAKAPQLAVIADPCGRATLCGSREDWLIPSGILGGNVSGLISRSILRADLIGEGDFHGCIVLDHLADIDLSCAFVERVDRALCALNTSLPEPQSQPAARFRQAAQSCIARIAECFEIDNLNRIKPGIAEATRAILRRKPQQVLVRSLTDDADLAALLHLCHQDGVRLTEAPELTGPYRAVTIIEKTS